MGQTTVELNPFLCRRWQHSTGGRSLEDVGHGLHRLPTEEDSAEEGAVRVMVLKAEMGQVLLQWGQCGDGLLEAAGSSVLTPIRINVVLVRAYSTVLRDSILGELGWH